MTVGLGAWGPGAVRVPIIRSLEGPGYGCAVPRFGRRQRGSAEPGSAGGASEEALAVARSDLAVVGDEVGVLDFDVQSPAAPTEAGAHYDDALRSYMVAGERVDRAERPADLVAVGEALERVRYQLACARALLDGAEPPAHVAPCLFDPRHGPSSHDVPWAPGGAAAVGGADGTAARPVPACAADARRLADQLAPDVRSVSLGSKAVPYWDVPVLYGPLLVGYYQRFGGAQRLSELLRGTPLGTALAQRAA